MATAKKTDIYTWANEKAGTIELPSGLFDAPWRPAAVQQVLVAQMANRREPWAHTKTRGEVRGGGKKPWRQKGTGRARHGSIRSPLWSGGGVTHGPRNERSYAQKVNKKMRRAAIVSVLSKKLADEQVVFFDTLALPAAKTKDVAARLKPFLGARAKKYDILFIPAPDNRAIFPAVANLPKAKAIGPNSLNVYDLLSYKKVFIDANALATMKNLYASRS